MAVAGAVGAASRTGSGPKTGSLGFLEGARGWALLLAFAAGSRLLARGSGAALHLGRRLGDRDFAGGGRLSGYERLRLPGLLVFGRGDLFPPAAAAPAGGHSLGRQQ